MGSFTKRNMGLVGYSYIIYLIDNNSLNKKNSWILLLLIGRIVVLIE